VGVAPVRLTARDVDLLGWLADFRTGATVRQVTRRFAIGESRARRRLAQLRSAGYLTHERVFWAKPGPYQVTAQGMAVVGVDRPEPQIDVRVYRHDLAVVDLAIEFELAGERVVTARAAETLEPPAGGLEALAAAYRDASHLAGAIVFVETPATRGEFEAVGADLRDAGRLELRSWTPREDG